MVETKGPVFLLTAFAILVIAGTRTTINFATMSKEPVPQPIANAWSEPFKGLSGRLHVEFEDLRPGLRHAVYLQIRNHSLNPVAVTNQPQVHAELFDSAGQTVSSSHFPMSGPIQSPQWAVIPRDACIGFRIDMQTVGVPTREHGTALIAVGGKSWALGAGKCVLKTTVVFKKGDDGPQHQWVGELELPPVEVVVTTQMLAVN